MAKHSGLGDRLFIAGYDLSGDIGSLGNIGGGPAPLDVTGIDKSAFEKIGGLRDGRFEYSSWFNPTTGRAHDRLSDLPTGSQVLTYCRGTTLGAPAAGIVGKQIDYAGKRANDGALSFEISTQCADGFPVEWGEQLTAGIRTDTGAASGTSVDYGAAVGTTNFGLQLYVHLFAFTGTSVTVTVQSSTDNAVGDPFATVTGATTGALTTVGASRVATGTSAAVERYLRVTTTGTFTDAQFHVLVVRNLAAPT